MPISRYFRNHGSDVLDNMKKTYGDTDKAKSVFYATANKNGMKPADEKAKPKRRMTLGQRIAAKD